MPSSSNPDAVIAPARHLTAVRFGFALFAVGLAFLVATVIPFFFDDHNRSLWLNLGCMLAPLGFVLAMVGVIRAGRAEQRAAIAGLESALETGR